jgi:hypothetical protein
MSRPARAIWRAEALRHDALAAERARVLVGHGAIAAEMLVERDAVVREALQPGKPALAVLDGLGTDVVTVHLQQVERAQDGARVGHMAADEVEHRVDDRAWLLPKP